MTESKQYNYYLNPSSDHYFNDQKLFILSETAQVWLNHISNPTHCRVLCKLILRAVQSYFNHQFHDFDAHTTSNCCHGMSLHVRKTLKEIKKIDAFKLNFQIEAGLSELENIEELGYYTWILKLHPSIIELASLYALTYCKEVFNNLGRKTKPKKLKTIEPVGTDFCNRLIQSLQKHYSNLISQSYWKYLPPMQDQIQVNSLPVEVWGEYVKPQHLRKNQYELLYAPCLYSMQVSLAHLIHTKAKIAIISDVMEESQCIERYVKILQGNGENGFDAISPHQEDVSEIVIVFGGCTYASEIPVEELMKPWLSKFPSLVLACDLYYPQFPNLSNDPIFDPSPINPDHESESIHEVIENHKSIKGVSAEDATLFCLTHIYPSSLKSILNVIEGQEGALPNFYIPFQVVDKHSQSANPIN